MIANQVVKKQIISDNINYLADLNVIQKKIYFNCINLSKEKIIFTFDLEENSLDSEVYAENLDLLCFVTMAWKNIFTISLPLRLWYKESINQSVS